MYLSLVISEIKMIKTYMLGAWYQVTSPMTNLIFTKAKLPPLALQQ